MRITDFVKIDVLFLHPPSVYDFRKGTVLFGPISDVVPSSSVFEMYPIGITSIADRLERAGYHVQVINMAYRMLRDPGYDPEVTIRRQQPRIWAIDLHWLPHVHGALALAELIKRHHPEAPVLMGGLSASYFHEELIERDCVDFVIRGDSTEDPVLALVESLRTGTPFADVPNLTWKDLAGNVHVNPLDHVPISLDEVNVPSYRTIMRSVFKYWNLRNILPYVRWLEYPMAALLTARGCTQQCAICGGSRQAYRQICGRARPAFRSPERLADDLKFIRRFSRAPVFVIHDIRMAGMSYARRFLDLLAREPLDNELVFELFGPAEPDFLRAIHEAVPNYSLELTLESHDPDLRRLNGKFAVSNRRIEATIQAALDHGCRRLDVFFMVGLPFQTRESVLESVSYARHLLETFGRDGRLQVYVAPLAPFLDPGSRAFEDPARFGYHLLAHTLEDHRQRLSSPLWSEILNYASVTMPPDEVVDTTYEAVERLSRVKAEFGLQSETETQHILALIQEARDLMSRIRAVEDLEPAERELRLGQLRGEALRTNNCRVYAQTDFVSWGKGRMLFRPLGLLRLMIELFFEELNHAWIRLSKRVYVWSPDPEAAESPAGGRSIASTYRGTRRSHQTPTA